MRLLLMQRKMYPQLCRRKRKKQNMPVWITRLLHREDKSCCWTLHFIPAGIIRSVCSWHMQEFRLWEIPNMEDIRKNSLDYVPTGLLLNIRSVVQKWITELFRKMRKSALFWRRGKSINLDKNKGLSYYIFKYYSLLTRYKKDCGGE